MIESVGIWVAIALIAAVVVVAGYRMAVGPDDANRAIASDLLFFAVIGLIALTGTLLANRYLFDIVLVATVVGFLASVSLARAITRGRR